MASKTKFITEVREKKPAKILYWDIETSPVLARTWGAYEQNILWVEEPWHLLTFAYAWDDGPIQVLALTDYELYDSDPHDDFALVSAAYELFEEADIVIAHNGVAFDTKKYNKQDVELLRELFYRLRPWSTRLPNMATMTDESGACPICGDTKKGLVIRGHRQTAVMVYTQVRCNACCGYSRVRQAFKTKT